VDLGQSFLKFKVKEKKIFMIEENHIYAFKKEFCKILKIPDNQAERRLSELLDWLTNYFDFEFYKGNPHRIFIKKIYGDY
jgi:hypothetical protein